MERFSNHGGDLMKQLKVELSSATVREGETAVFTYVEIGQLLSHAYAVSYIEGVENLLRLKVWNCTYDFKRFKFGIYNLDRLAILESDISLTSKQLNTLDSLLAEDIATVKLDRIVLDGLHCKLSLKEQTLVWNIDQSMNTSLLKLVSIVRETVGHQVDYLF